MRINSSVFILIITLVITNIGCSGKFSASKTVVIPPAPIVVGLTAPEEFILLCRDHSSNIQFLTRQEDCGSNELVTSYVLNEDPEKGTIPVYRCLKAYENHFTTVPELCEKFNLFEARDYGYIKAEQSLHSQAIAASLQDPKLKCLQDITRHQSFVCAIDSSPLSLREWRMAQENSCHWLSVDSKGKNIQGDIRFNYQIDCELILYNKNTEQIFKMPIHVDKLSDPTLMTPISQNCGATAATGHPYKCIITTDFSKPGQPVQWLPLEDHTCTWLNLDPHSIKYWGTPPLAGFTWDPTTHQAPGLSCHVSLRATNSIGTTLDFTKDIFIHLDSNYLVKDINSFSSSRKTIFSFGTKLGHQPATIEQDGFYFMATNGYDGYQIWKSTGFRNGTHAVTQFPEGTLKEDLQLITHRGHIYFSALTDDKWNLYSLSPEDESPNLLTKLTDEKFYINGTEATFLFTKRVDAGFNLYVVNDSSPLSLRFLMPTQTSNITSIPLEYQVLDATTANLNNYPLEDFSLIIFSVSILSGPDSLFAWSETDNSLVELYEFETGTAPLRTHLILGQDLNNVPYLLWTFSNAGTDMQIVKTDGTENGTNLFENHAGTFLALGQDWWPQNLPAQPSNEQDSVLYTTDQYDVWYQEIPGLRVEHLGSFSHLMTQDRNFAWANFIPGSHVLDVYLTDFGFNSNTNYGHIYHWQKHTKYFSSSFILQSKVGVELAGSGPPVPEPEPWTSVRYQRSDGEWIIFEYLQANEIGLELWAQCLTPKSNCRP